MVGARQKKALAYCTRAEFFLARPAARCTNGQLQRHLVDFAPTLGGFSAMAFLTNPRRQYNALGLFQDGLLAGFAVYHIKDQSHLHIDDLFTAANNIKGLQALVVALLEIASVACVDLVCFTAHNELWQTLMIPMGFTFRDDGHLFGVAVKTANYKRILLILRAGGLPVAIPILKVLAVWLSKHLSLKARPRGFH